VRFVLEAIISERRAHAAQDSIEGMTDLPVKRPKRPRDPAQLAKLIVDIATGEVEDRDPNEGKDPAASPRGVTISTFGPGHTRASARPAGCAGHLVCANGDGAAVITGAQIRQARKLLGWEPFQLAQRARLHLSIVQRAESVDVEPPITTYQEALNGDPPGVIPTRGLADSLGPSQRAWRAGRRRARPRSPAARVLVAEGARIQPRTLR